MFFFVGVLSTEQKKSLNQHNWIRDEGEGKFVFQTKSSIHHSVCFASFVVVREKKHPSVTEEICYKFITL